MAENPYQSNSPIIDPERFAGRREAIQFVQTQLGAPTQGVDRRALVILGPPQIGKSSLLRMMRFHLDARYCPVRLSLRAGTVAGEAAWLKALAQTMPDALELLDIQSARLPELPARPAELRAALLGEYLADGLHALRQHRQLVVLIDNADRLLMAVERGALPGDTFAFLGELLAAHADLHLLLACDARRESDLIAAGYPFDPAYFFRLGPLSREEHAHLLLAPARGVEGLSYTPEALDALYDLSGGEPYLANVLAHELFERAGPVVVEPVDVAQVEAAVEPALNVAADVLGAVWQEGSAQTRLVLTALVALSPDEPPVPVPHDDLAAWLLAVNRPVDPRTVNATWRQLEYEGVVDLVGEGRLLIRGGLRRRWLRAHVDVPRPGVLSARVAPALGGRRAFIALLVVLGLLALLLIVALALPGPEAGSGAGAATITLDLDLQATNDAYYATQTAIAP